MRTRYTDTEDCTCDICGRKKFSKFVRTTKKNKPGDLKKLVGFSIHHKHYRTMYKESRDDIMILCNNCHDAGHMLATNSRICPSVYGQLYDNFVTQTGWEHEPYIIRKKQKYVNKGKKAG